MKPVLYLQPTLEAVGETETWLTLCVACQLSVWMVAVMRPQGYLVPKGSHTIQMNRFSEATSSIRGFGTK